jgi:hypothetical protein
LEIQESKVNTREGKEEGRKEGKRKREQQQYPTKTRKLKQNPKER